MFYPVPHGVRFFLIVVLMSASGNSLLAQPGPRIRIQQGPNVIFPMRARPAPPKMLAPIVPPPPPMPTRVPLDPDLLDALGIQTRKKD